MSTGYIVVQTQHQGRVWSVSKSLAGRLGLKTNSPAVLECGAISSPVLVEVMEPADFKTPVIGLSGEALNTLGIPENSSLLIKASGNNTFRLGPVIGIMTFPGHIPHRLGYYRMYARRVKNGLVYVFRGRNINQVKYMVKGYYYDRVRNTWKEADLPYPDAVMDRCYPNPYVCHRMLEKVIGRGKIFNKRTMIDKISFCKAMTDDSYLRHFVPQTLFFRQAGELEEFLQRYGEVFLKPTNGMKGAGIVAVSKTRHETLLCRYSIKGTGYVHEIPCADKIFGVLQKAAGRRRPYIIQQGIPRLTYKGGPFSLRVWAMKNGRGVWVVPGMFAKGTFGQGFLTNFTAGAKLIPLKELFNEIIPQTPFTKMSLLREMEDLTLRAAAALDKKYGPLGELGLDIVFDTKGKPWLIEANGNPGNIPIFRQREYPLWPNLVFQYPADYAVYLAGFSGD